LAPLPDRLASLGRLCATGIDGELSLAAEQEAATEALQELRLLVHGLGPSSVSARRSARQQ